MWSNFDVDHLDWITMDFELKFEYSSGLEFELNSKEILRILLNSKLDQGD
jgi:hypothetical protein